MKSLCHQQPELTTKSQKTTRRFRRRHSPRRVQPEPNQAINLSSIHLSQDHIKLLSFGPKFCPTPGSYNEVQLLEDTMEGLRRIRLKEFWFDENAPAQIPSRPKFYKKSHWEPPNGRDEALDAYCSSVVTKVTAHVSGVPEHATSPATPRRPCLNYDS